MYNEENYDNYEDESTEEEEQSSGSKIREIYENNKKLIWILGIIIVFIIIAAIFTGGGGSSSGEDNSVVGPINRPEYVQLSKSKDLRIKVRGKEYNGSYSAIQWNSRNSNVAEVDSSGRITGKKIGNTVITGVFEENNDSHAFTVDVVVVKGNENVKLQNVDFNSKSLVINSVVHEYSIGEQLHVVPDDAYVHDVIYSSSNSSVASVDEAGIVKGISPGTATITASINDGAFEALLDVYVRDDVVEPKLIKIPQKVEFEDGTSLKLELNGTKELKLAPSPSDADSDFINWKSTDNSIVAVTDDGMISGVKLGTATITATALNGKEGKIVVEVVQETVAVDSISIVPSSVTMNAGESRTLLPTVKPDNASNKSFTFESSDTTVASVVPTATKTSATVYALKGGTAIITVKSDNGKIATLTVKVSGSGGSSQTGPSTQNSGSGSITVRLSNNEVTDKKPNKTCNGLIDYYKGPLTVTITKSGDVASIAYCHTKGCTPSKKETFDNKEAITFTIPAGGTYILKVRKYNSSGNEIASSNSNNYDDGSLVYYINTKQSGLSCTSKSTWESGGSTVTTTTTTKGACYVNTSTQGVSNSFTWRDAGSTMSAYTNLAETVITTKSECERAANNSNGQRNLCFRNGNNYYFGSQYAVKAAYPNNRYVSNVITKDSCLSNSSDLTNIVINNGNTITFNLSDKTKEVSITLTPSTVNQNVTISSSNEKVFKVDKTTTKTSTTVKLTAISEGEEYLIVKGSNGKEVKVAVKVVGVDKVHL